ncbi:MAG: DUF3047 domain-containing protein [Rhodoferax sp.]
MLALTKIASLGLLLPLLGCASFAPSLESERGYSAISPWTQASAHAWRHHKFPGKGATQFTYARQDGRDAMAASAVSSASMLRQTVHIPPDQLGQVKFSWKVPELIAQADMALREVDDSPVRIVLAFDGDRSRFSVKNAMLSELSHAITGEPLPYATLMYVWCNSRAPGTVIVNPRTDRIRTLVVESGGKNLNLWLDYERDIRADYAKAFGESPGALVGIGIMTDTDNTRSTTHAWYGQLTLAAGK